ncbi:hypothetical protein BT67DRAFT_445061 [Trichocladium antarcticum]|uniref:Uncharacterized protein n=1 Tax=Trichocladium antarcticum TaxID=1450529 RepID=A0AAN6UDN2_9PEZI|nr:hypothetical protein BT67DRAFT_445061 [Trichocladium antarcticum]
MDKMPVSIAIPHQRHRQADGPESASSPSSYSSSPSTPGASPKTPSRAAQKQKMLHTRRPSLLSSAFSKQECTTIKIGDDPEGPMRLVTYLASGQGFVWNPEIFLPSFGDYDYVPLEQRRDPVHEIFLSDEEIKKILPQ